MGSQIISVRLTVLGFVMVVTILALAFVVSIAQEAQPAPPSSTSNTPPDSQTQDEKEQEEKVAPERLLFIVYEAFRKRFQNPMGVFYDSHQDEIFVADTGNHRVVILDGTDGFPKLEFDHLVRRSGQSKVSPGEPRNIAVNSLGEIFIVDNLADYVNVCDFRGEHIMDIRIENYMLMPVEDPAQYANVSLKPVAVAVDSKDNLYVATTRWIFIFDMDLEFQRQLSREGQGPAEFDAIADLWVDADGKIFVVSMKGTAIKVLSLEGEELLAFGEHEVGLTNFSLPSGIITDRRGYIWVVDTLRHIVPIFDANGNFLDYIGAFGAGPGYFAFPSAIAASDDGKIVVLERVNRRLQCFELAQPSGEEMAASVEETTSEKMVEE